MVHSDEVDSRAKPEQAKQILKSNFTRLYLLWEISKSPAMVCVIPPSSGWHSTPNAKANIMILLSSEKLDQLLLSMATTPAASLNSLNDLNGPKNSAIFIYRQLNF